MAGSPLIKRYFSNPGDPELENLAFEEIGAYSSALSEKFVFWINDIDKILHATEHDPYVIVPENPENYWYNMTLYETDIYNFNINYNPDLNITNLWINAPVFNNEGIPIGIVGTGINLTNFLYTIYANYTGSAELYFFNAVGEITGARNPALVANKKLIEQELGLNGEAIMAKISSFVNDRIIYFHLDTSDGIAALGVIPALDWYVTAIHYFTILGTLQTGMTVLFVVMIAIIFIIFAIINVFIGKLLQPLSHIVNEISRISSDWDLKHHDESGKKGEIETLGEFLNMTIIDPLTGINNRRFFDGSMKKIIKSLSRTDSKLSLLMIDIDYFKKYNDTYGHNMGDKCLKKVSGILSRSITRDEDFVARYGGEEFAVVLPNTNEEGASIIAEKLLKNVRKSNIRHEKSETAAFVTISIGITTGVVKHSQDEGDFIKTADAALYESKQKGRNQYSFIPL